jgi:DNA gyrase subunit B
MSNETTRSTSNYDESQITVLEGLEAVRKRPGMYIGLTDVNGLHNMIREVVDNSVDEVLAGRATSVEVVIHTDGSVTVADDGAGIPVGPHPKMGISTLQVVMTVLHAGGKFGQGGYKVSSGLHGVGVSVVNALSDELIAEVRRNGRHYKQVYRHGVPQGDVEDVGPAERSGTTVTFLPDQTIFHTLDYNFKTLSQRFREMSYLTKGLRFRFVDERDDKELNFYFEGGIVSYVRHLNKDKSVLHKPPFYVERTLDDVNVEVALQYTEAYDTDSVYAFANNINNADGGTHLTGFRTALTRVINNYARSKNILKENEANLTGDDVREGLTAVISVKLREPQFNSQTKEKLVSPEASGAVAAVFGDAFAAWLEEHPGEARRIIEKTLQAARTRMAVQKVRETSRKTAMDGFSLPGKLADCSDTNPARSELYIVEGDSAGGCLFYDTSVKLSSGIVKSMRALADDWERGIQHFGYATNEAGDICIVPLVHPRLTKRDAELVEVELDNGETIRCTPDHRFRLRDGSYQRADQLQSDTSLMPLKTRLSPREEFARAGDEMVWMNGQERWSLTHQLADQSNLHEGVYAEARGKVPHHKDFNRHNRQQAYFDGDEQQMLEVAANFNCKVVAVRQLEERADVYDLTIEGYHNFALAAGVFVHNSAKQGRDRRFQAILPLRGKILNVEKSRLDKMLSNNEVRALITAIGSSVGETFDPEKLRYHRVVIMTDADVDGSHIRTLLLTFFYRYMRGLITNGHLYIAQPPLYLIKNGKEHVYVYSDAERDAYLNKLESAVRERIIRNNGIQRYKGLGEMNAEQLWDTTMNPANRVILQVTLEDALQADETFTMLMGDMVPPRRRFIQTHATEVRNLDV